MNKAKFVTSLCQISNNHEVNKNNFDKCIDYHKILDTIYDYIYNKVQVNCIPMDKIYVKPIDFFTFENPSGVYTIYITICDKRTYSLSNESINGYLFIPEIIKKDKQCTTYIIKIDKSLA